MVADRRCSAAFLFSSLSPLCFPSESAPVIPAPWALTCCSRPVLSPWNRWKITHFNRHCDPCMTDRQSHGAVKKASVISDSRYSLELRFDWFLKHDQSIIDHAAIRALIAYLWNQEGSAAVCLQFRDCERVQSSDRFAKLWAVIFLIILTVGNQIDVTLTMQWSLALIVHLWNRKVHEVFHFCAYIFFAR